MPIIRQNPSQASLVGGDLSVDISHTEDSVALGDQTNLAGPFSLIGTQRAVPVELLGISTLGLATGANLTAGTAKFQIWDPGSADGGGAEVDLVGSERALKVSVIAQVGGGGGGTAATDSAAYTATVSQFTPIGGAFDDVSSDALAEGEMGICRVTSGRALHVAVQNTVTVSGTIAATQSGTWNIGSITTLPSIPAGTNNIGDVDVLTLPALPTGSNVIGAVTQSGTWNIGTLTSITNTVTVSGTITASSTTGAVAHDAAVSGNPVLIAGRAQNANPTPVANGDASHVALDLAGRVITQPFGPRELITRGNATVSTTTETTLLAAGGAGVFHDALLLVITNTSSTATRVDVRDTTAGTVLFSVGLASYGGAVIPLHGLPQTTANTNWTVQLGTAVTDLRAMLIAVKRT